MAEDREACLAAGMDDYVAKPIRPEALGEALGRVRPLAAPDGSDTVAPLRLDEAALGRLRELGGEEFLVELIDTFLAGADGHVASLRRSIDHGDADELRRVAHTLKSSAATFGAGELEEHARELEERARSGRLGDAVASGNRLELEVGRLCAALRRLADGAAGA